MGNVLLEKSMLIYALKHALNTDNINVTKVVINSIKTNIRNLNDGDVALLICEIELSNTTDSIWIELKEILFNYLHEYNKSIIN